MSDLALEKVEAGEATASEPGTSFPSSSKRDLKKAWSASTPLWERGFGTPWRAAGVTKSYENGSISCDG